MRPVYIGHSGFMVETERSQYIFDYYEGRLPRLSPEKPVVVFASHGHPDHYNPAVFHMLKMQGIKDILAVLSKDILSRRYPEGIEVVRALGGNQYTLPRGELVETLYSTDVGVAYLLTTPEGVIYHGGDLNDWGWEGESREYNRQMRGSYRHEIDKLKGRAIDIAFLPLDPRQEERYADGMHYFLSKVGAKAAYPMHYWGRPEVIGRFLREYPLYEGTVLDTEGIKL